MVTGWHTNSNQIRNQFDLRSDGKNTRYNSYGKGCGQDSSYGIPKNR